MRRILLLGANGQVGWELQRSLAALGTINPVDRRHVNLEQPDSLRNFVRSNAADVIVNAAAYTAVDKAEIDSETAMRVNAHAVRVLAQEAARSDALLVHYSTDYVFDGTKAAAYTEDDTPNPINVYGSTKLAGERAIQEADCKHLIFRTSWVYGRQGNNFAKTVLRLANERQDLKVVDDQVGAPTSAALVADVTALCLAQISRSQDSQAYGVYQVVAAGHTSWLGYAKAVVEAALALGVQLKLAPNSIKPISTAEYVTAAKRPLNSRLTTDKLKVGFGLDMPHWATQVERFITELVGTVK